MVNPNHFCEKGRFTLTLVLMGLGNSEVLMADLDSLTQHPHPVPHYMFPKPSAVQLSAFKCGQRGSFSLSNRPGRWPPPQLLFNYFQMLLDALMRMGGIMLDAPAESPEPAGAEGEGWGQAVCVHSASALATGHSLQCIGPSLQSEVHRWCPWNYIQASNIQPVLYKWVHLARQFNLLLLPTSAATRHQSQAS